MTGTLLLGQGLLHERVRRDSGELVVALGPAEVRPLGRLVVQALDARPALLVHARLVRLLRADPVADGRVLEARRMVGEEGLVRRAGLRPIVGARRASGQEA